jgi:hypothetical protein
VYYVGHDDLVGKGKSAGMNNASCLTDYRVKGWQISPGCRRLERNSTFEIAFLRNEALQYMSYLHNSHSESMPEHSESFSIKFNEVYKAAEMQKGPEGHNKRNLEEKIFNYVMKLKIPICDNRILEQN